MTQDTIFSPFFATVFLTLLVWVYMYIRRIIFLTSRKLSQKELAVPGTLAQISPPNVSNPSDNFKNLFEILIIFYALVLSYLLFLRCVAMKLTLFFEDCRWRRTRRLLLHDF
jgi:hypothetical protein